jgi:hypothetical protein
MPAENTLTATPAAAPPGADPTSPTPTATPSKEQVLEAEVAMLRGKLKVAEEYVTKMEARPRISPGFAQQLFLNNLSLVNEPNCRQAWERTEEQIKFLQDKGVA